MLDCEWVVMLPLWWRWTAYLAGAVSGGPVRFRVLVAPPPVVSYIELSLGLNRDGSDRRALSPTLVAAGEPDEVGVDPVEPAGE